MGFCYVAYTCLKTLLLSWETPPLREDPAYLFPRDPPILPSQFIFIPSCQVLMPRYNLSLGHWVTTPGWNSAGSYYPSCPLVRPHPSHPRTQQPVFRCPFSLLKPTHWQPQLLIQTQGPPCIPLSSLSLQIQPLSYCNPLQEPLLPSPHNPLGM